MSEAWLSLGGLGVRLCGGAGVDAAMRIDGMAHFATGSRRTDITLHLDSAPMPDNIAVLHSFDIADGAARCRFGTDNEGSYVYLFDGLGATRFDPRRPDEAYCSAIQSQPLMKFALWTMFSMTGLWRGVLPVHSSVAVCDGKAVMCLGESGTGKSTHTRLWLANIPGTRLLNDDSPLLSLAGGRPVVCGSPWSGKTPCYRQECHPAAAAVRIVQRPKNTIERLGVVEAFAALQPSCPPCLMKDERLQDRLVDFVGRAIGAMPVYRLGCRPDAEAAHLCHNTVFAL